jgi:3-oxoadipate enol-lactonase
MPYAQLSRVRMHYFERGHGRENVVFVHGYQASGRIWQLVQAELPEDRYRTFALNNRGAGESDAPPADADFTVECFAADLYEFVSQLALSDFTLVGHSLGGLTATQFAIEHGDLLKGLVVLDSADPDGRPITAAEVERIVEDVSRRRRGATAPAADANTSASAVRNEFARALAADIAAAPEQRLRGSMRSMLTIRIGERVRQLTMPVLFACGDADELFPLATLLASWAKFPKGTGLAVWHGVGHSPNVEVPEQLAAVLRRFIEHTVPSAALRRNP